MGLVEVHIVCSVAIPGLDNSPSRTRNEGGSTWMVPVEENLLLNPNASINPLDSSIFTSKLDVPFVDYPFGACVNGTDIQINTPEVVSLDLESLCCRHTGKTCVLLLLLWDCRILLGLVSCSPIFQRGSAQLQYQRHCPHPHLKVRAHPTDHLLVGCCGLRVTMMAMTTAVAAREGRALPPPRVIRPLHRLLHRKAGLIK